LEAFDKLESGKYYSDCKVKKETLNKDWKEEANKLWKISEEIVAKFK
jgi:hypothetical protein